MKIKIEPNGIDYSRSRVIIENVDLPLLEKQRKSLASEPSVSSKPETEGLLNFLDAICDAWYFATNIDKEE